jgi:multiple sugar transport system permease protein
LLNVSQQQFVGFHNFAQLFTSGSEFYVALRQSAIWTFGNVLFQLVLGTIGALILNSKIRGRAAIRGLVLVPWATPSVLVALMWGWMLDPNLGIIDHLLQSTGLMHTPTAFLANTTTALPTLMFIDIWQGVPFFAVMILAALQGVPGEQIEAAKVDGASSWRTFWSVVLPLIMPTILITTVLRLIWTANYFDIILILTNGGPIHATLTLPLLSYQTAYSNFDFGGAAAVVVVQAAILSLLAIFYIRRVGKRDLA